MTGRTLSGEARAAAISVALHLVALALLLWWVRTPEQAPTESALKVFDTAGAATQPVAAKPRQPVNPIPPRRDGTRSVAPTAAPAGAGAAGTVCAIGGALQAALAADPLATAEIAAIPRDALAVSSATVMWSPDPAIARPVLPQADAVIDATLATVPPECLDAEQAGPEFLYLPTDGGGVLIVALGSGRWRWRNYFDALHPDDETIRS